MNQRYAFFKEIGRLSHEFTGIIKPIAKSLQKLVKHLPLALLTDLPIGFMWPIGSIKQ